MITIHLLFIFIGALCRMASSSDLLNSRSASLSVIIKGHINHAPLGDTVWLEYRPHLGRRAQRVRLSSSGDFEFTLHDMTGPTHASVYYAGQRASLYLTPGDQLKLTTDFPRFRESMHYTGQGASANNYLARAYAKFEYVSPGAFRPDINSFSFICESPTQERQRTEVFRKERHDFLATYQKQYPLPEAFRTHAAAHIDLLWTRIILTYTGDHPRLARTRQQQLVLGTASPTIAIPADYFTFMQQLAPSTFSLPSETIDRGYDDTQLVYECLDLYADNLLPGSARSPEPATLANIYTQATTDLGSTPARDYAVVKMLLDKQARIDANWVVAAYPVFRANNRDSTASRLMRQFMKQRL
jgi:hypothetical protein